MSCIFISYNEHDWYCDWQNHSMYWSLCGLVKPYDVIKMVNIGSDNGLLPDDIKPSTLIINKVLQHSLKTNFTGVLKTSIHKMSLKMTLVKWNFFLTGQWVNTLYHRDIIMYAWFRVVSEVVIFSRKFPPISWQKGISRSARSGGPLTHLPLDKNGCHFADDIVRCIFVNEKFCILIKISPKFVPQGQTDNNPAWV